MKELLVHQITSWLEFSIGTSGVVPGVMVSWRWKLWSPNDRLWYERIVGLWQATNPVFCFFGKETKFVLQSLRPAVAFDMTASPRVERKQRNVQNSLEVFV